MANSKINIGPLLKNHRKNCSLTQQQVADALKINRTTYTYYESGKTEPSIETINSLCRIFGIEYEDLLPDVKTAQVKDMRFVPRSNQEIYTLAKDEQDLIIKFRTLSEEEQQKIIDAIEEASE